MKFRFSVDMLPILKSLKFSQYIFELQKTIRLLFIERDALEFGESKLSNCRYRRSKVVSDDLTESLRLQMT